MAVYRLVNALPQSVSGSEEFHYGYLCKVENNGVWIDLNEQNAKNFLLGGRIYGPIVPDEIEKEEVKVKEVEKAEVKEEVKESKKRGPKPKTEDIKNIANEIKDW